MTGTRHLDAERLSPTVASSLLGLPYELVLRYVHELERQGLLKVQREIPGRLFLSPADLDLLRRHHEERPVASKFKVEGDVDQHRYVLQDLKTLASTLETMARLARTRIKVLTQGPASSTTWISTLPAVGLTLRKPIPVSVVSDGKAFSAFCADAGSTASGRNRREAVRALRKLLAMEFVYLGQLASPSEEEAERLADLQRLILRDEGEREEIP